MKFAYLVHDLADPAVERRLRVLMSVGLTPNLLGFRRGDKPIASVAGVAAVELGRTVNARMGKRVASLAACALRLARWRSRLDGAELLVARNLEMLLLAAVARARFAPSAALVYECLDIHTMLVGNSPKAQALRRVERWLLAKCGLLVTSSPAFIENHFRKHYGDLPTVLLSENKLLASEMRAVPPTMEHFGPPWRIAWFGVLRCQRSLHQLAALARALPGEIDVAIWGRPALDAVPDFHDVVAATPGLHYFGPYDRNTDLPKLYSNVNFTWAIDYYESGANSQWLLPNRLYEGGAYGAVHLAVKGTETARWLGQHGVGVVLDEPLDASLAAFFAKLDRSTYDGLRENLLALSPAYFVADEVEARKFAAALEAAADGSADSVQTGANG